MQYVGDYLVTNSFVIRSHIITAFDNTFESINKALTVTLQ